MTLARGMREDRYRMQTQSTYQYLFVRILLVDAITAVGATISWFVNLEIHDVVGAIGMCVGLFVIHVLLWGLHLRRLVEPQLGWERGGTACSDAELLAADVTADRLPVQLALGWSLTWLVYFGGIIGLAWFALPQVLSFGWLELSAMAFQLVALTAAPAVVMFPLASLLLQDMQMQIGAELGRRSLEQSRAPAPMARRLGFAVVGLLLATSTWLSALAWLSLGEGIRDATLERVSAAVRWSAHGVADGSEALGDGVELVSAAELPAELAAELAAEGRGSLGEAGEILTHLDKRSERVTAAAAVGDGRWVVAREVVVFEQSKHWIGQIVTMLVTLFSTFLMIASTTRLVIDPLERLRSTLRRVSEVGDLVEVGRIPVLRKDEVGELTDEFNGMLDTFEDLANAARAVADGDLRVTIEGPGDLQDAFRVMVGRLGELVAQIRDAAVEVATAASEIHAAALSQEEAAGQQSDGIREVSAAMEGLSESAGSIAQAADEVLANAQLTRTRADQVVEKITELGEHITRVGELLDLIREVADRSDLLALNGSLEATRAGDAGRGFALVANEMRRLAERVTGTVTDVRETIADISAASAGTVAAIQDSRELADLTTGAAHRIVEVTASQSTQTVSVSAGTRDISGVVASSAVATTQIRVAAGSLRERAGRLEKLIDHFEVGDAARPAPGQVALES